MGDLGINAMPLIHVIFIYQIRYFVFSIFFIKKVFLQKKILYWKKLFGNKLIEVQSLYRSSSKEAGRERGASCVLLSNM